MEETEGLFAILSSRHRHMRLDRAVERINATGEPWFRNCRQIALTIDTSGRAGASTLRALPMVNAVVGE
jgi:hypothetical protein